MTSLPLTPSLSNDGVTVFFLYWLGTGIMLFGVLRAFYVGCKADMFIEALISGWFLLVIGSVTNDIVSPFIGEKILGHEKARILYPETPGTMGMLCVGWWPPIVFYWAGRAGRYLVRDMLLCFRPAPASSKKCL